jgi:hypothetical protein
VRRRRATTADYSLRTVGSSKLISSYQYDVFGHLSGKVMPNGNSGATINSSGDLSGSGTPATSNWGTTYSYYGLTETATTPSPIRGVDCEPSVATAQLALLKSQQQHAPRGDDNDL